MTGCEHCGGPSADSHPCRGVVVVMKDGWPVGFVSAAEAERVEDEARAAAAPVALTPREERRLGFFVAYLGRASDDAAPAEAQ